MDAVTLTYMVEGKTKRGGCDGKGHRAARAGSGPSDRRVVYAGLTSDGQRMLEEAAPLLCTGHIEHLGAREADVVTAVTVAMRKVLEAEGVAPSSSGPTMKTRLDPASGLAAAGSATGWAPDSAAAPLPKEARCHKYP